MQSNDVPEVWRPVVGYEGRYEVSNQGKVRSLARTVKRVDGVAHTVPARTLKPHTLHCGHRNVSLYRDGESSRFYVHRLVAEAFLPRPVDGQEVCHNNGNPADNRVSNLRWGSRSENMLDEVRSGRHWQTKKTHCAKGHEYSPENTAIWGKKHKTRVCRKCNAEWRANHQRRKAERIKGEQR